MNILKKIFTHQAVKVKPIKRENKLKKFSLRVLGTFRQRGNRFVTHDNIEYCIYKVSFLQANGIERSVTEENKAKLVNILNQFQHDFKVVYFKDVTISLDSTIKSHEERLDKVNQPSIRYIIEDRLKTMAIFKNRKYEEKHLFIQEHSRELFEDLFSEVYSLEMKKGSVLLRRLNNDME